ncbi:MAG TPA: alpha/beta hydrolase family protein [Tepidisphaeraceae bacterium]|jgi:dienelactone hydrolase
MDETAGRNISVEKHFATLGKRQKPRHRFEGTTSEAFEKWKGELRPKVLASLGKRVEKVALNPAVIWEREEEGVIKRRVIVDVEEGLSAPVLVYRPAGATGKLPAILCCHGHGPYGKDAVMGIASDEARRKHIRECNYDYGLQMAKKGFVTAAIDWRGFGERNEHGGTDYCNKHFIREALIGRTLLGMDIHDGQCVLDYLQTLEFVDAKKIGVMGLSFGGTMTTWIALTDERIKAADIICYSDRFESFAMKRANFCGSQMTPGLFELCDVPDLQGLIAPLPLLVEIGRGDACFPIGPAKSCYEALEQIYIAAGAHEGLLLDEFEGGHMWGGNLSERFFRKYLA